MEGTNRGCYYVQPGSNCGFGASSQAQELTAQAGMEKVDEKREKKKKRLSKWLLKYLVTHSFYKLFCEKEGRWVKSEEVYL